MAALAPPVQSNHNSTNGMLISNSVAMNSMCTAMGLFVATDNRPFCREANAICRALAMVMIEPQSNPTIPANTYETPDPPMTLADYVRRILMFSRIQTECVPYAVALFARLVLCGCPISLGSVHKAFAVCVMCADKVLNELPTVLSIPGYASVFGVTPSSLRKMEITFLCQVGFAVNIDPALHKSYTETLRLLGAPSNHSVQSN